jgi:hypothetical protein
MSEADFVKKLEDHFRAIKVADFLGQAIMSISQLGWQRITPGETQDLAQARLAIEAIRALVPVIEPGLPEQAVRDLQQSVANMQLAYAGAVAQTERPPGEDPPAGS